MDNTIHTPYRCQGQSHHLHMTSINHFIHVNISCKHISIFTFNMSFYDQEMTHTSKPCNGHCTYNSSHVNTLEYTYLHPHRSQHFQVVAHSQSNHNRPHNSSKLSSETSPLTVQKTGHKSLNNLSYSSPGKLTIT